MTELKFDPAPVEAALGFELPHPRQMTWQLVERDGRVELEIFSAKPVPYPPVTVPAELVDHLEHMTLDALRNLQKRVAAGRVRDGAILLSELHEFDLLLSGAPGDLWIGLRHRGRRQVSIVPFTLGSDIVACLCAAKCALLHYGLAQQQGFAN